VLEAAHALAGGEFDDTIVFISFSGEEQGLFGSAGAARPGHLHQLIFGNNVPPGAQTVAMLNNDISGGDNLANRGNDFGAFRLYAGGVPRERNQGAEDGTPDNTSPQRGLMRFIKIFGVPFVDGFKMRENLREDRPGRSSDQVSFITAGAPVSGSGVPAVRFIESHECSSSPVNNSCPASDPNDPHLLTSGRPCPSPFAALPRINEQHNCLHTQFVCAPGTTPLASCTLASATIPATRLCLNDDERAHGILLDPATPAGASPTHYVNEGCVDATSRNPFHNFQRQHAPNDRPEFPTADYEAKIAGVMSATLASLARAPNPPTFKASGNANAVTLAITPAQGDNVNKFAVSARLTTSNFFNKDRVLVVGNTASVTPKQLGIRNGESFFITVSALDDVGHESLFAWPEFRCDAAGCVAPATWNNLATK
jgi:Peptidase family M28